ncbi:MAG TPA: hypothetical protein VFE33_17890 [Thermoanaerobaculia bacterium]|nr:hypothetical protein [Thermoanaerobaculia bacterium]
MNNLIYDGVLINLLQKGPTAGSFLTIARQFMGVESVSARYKQSVRDFSVEEFSPDSTSYPEDDEYRRLFRWHYQPRIYQVFGFFDLAILQLCDSVEIISELSTQRDISATQNIFGLRTCTGSTDRKLCGSLELCSPLLPYIFICNAKIHPMIQMLFGKDLQGLLNIHFSHYLDEINVLRRTSDPTSDEDLITLAILDTYGWNELTFLVHGSSFERMLAFVWNRIRALRLVDLQDSDGFGATLSARIANLAQGLHAYGLDRSDLAEVIDKIPLFSHTETVPGIDYGICRRLRGALPLQDAMSDANFFSAVKRDFQERLGKHSIGSKYLGRTASVEIEPAIDRIVDDMREDTAGCLSGFSLRPGLDYAFHQKFSEVFEQEKGQAGEVVLGQHDFFFKQFRDAASSGRLLARLQKIIHARAPRQADAAGPDTQQLEDVFSPFRDLVVSSKTAICSQIVLRPVPTFTDPFETLRRNLPRIFKFKRAAPGEAPAVLVESCRRIQMPKPLQISLEHTLEPFYSFLQNPSLFSQYIDLYLPLLLITRQIERAAAGRGDDHRPVAEHISRELRQFNHAFQARFQASHVHSENTEATLEFKAHTVTPLDTIQCIIDCFTQTFVGFDKIAGFPLISVSSRPQVHPSRVFSVELNSFHLLYPESLVVLFHEMGHLYLQYGERPKGDRAGRSRTVPPSCLRWMFQTDDEQAVRRWQAFTSLIPAEKNAQPIDSYQVAMQAEEVLADLLLLTSIFRNDWEVFLWYMLTQIESLSEYFPEDAPVGDPRQVGLYREITMRLFLVYIFRFFAASAKPAIWHKEIDFPQFQEFTSGLRGKSKKIRDFCSRQDTSKLDSTAWRLVCEFVRPTQSLAPRAAEDGIVWFQANEDFWTLSDTADIPQHPGLPAMFMSLIFIHYRWMLEDIVLNWIRSYRDQDLWAIDYLLNPESSSRLAAGECAIAELNALLDRLMENDSIAPVAYLDILRAAPSSDKEGLPGRADDDVWEAAYRRITRALYAIIKFFHDENSGVGVEDDFRYLYRHAATGKPERFEEGRSDVEESPFSSGAQRPLPIVIDRRGVFFCRSTATRQRAFQYRNAVIRELADIHYKLRPAKMAEIMKITNAYLAELRPETH